ncbi:MAG: hypothetical protein LBT75_01665 [Bacilli bacterium]|jgi:hypothetical protein|nr:hypothetical protein [Bacilli bacterium]
MKRICLIIFIINLIIFNYSITALKNTCRILNSSNQFIRNCNINKVDFNNLEDGNYSLEVTSEDDATNKSKKIVKFTIDYQAPTIEVVKKDDDFIINVHDAIDEHPLIKYYLNNQEYQSNIIKKIDYLRYRGMIRIEASDAAQNKNITEYEVKNGNLNNIKKHYEANNNGGSYLTINDYILIALQGGLVILPIFALIFSTYKINNIKKEINSILKAK